MFGKYFKKFLYNSVTYGFGSLFIGFPWIVYYTYEESPFVASILVIIFLFIVSYGTSEDVRKENEVEIGNDIRALNSQLASDKERAEQKANSLVKICQEKIDQIQEQADTTLKEAEEKLSIAEKKQELSKQILKERASGFPTLFSILSQYDENVDNYFAGYFVQKSHPAIRASETIKEESKRRRVAEFLQRKTQSIIEYYENLAPFLLEYKEQEIDDTDEALKEYTEEEREDPVTNYLTKEEYRKLSSVVRNQMALERYWKRPKPKWLLGRMYERYVGYIYESQGYDVEYVGVFKGYEDLGRDLICTKGKETIIIQCKNWSQFKTIFEKHIFQFFGTVFQYRDELKNKRVKGIFYTTTELSKLARRFANELGIELEERFKMKQDYPCIKCNITDGGKTKIYHLPFDQQYDNVKIEPEKKEFYSASVEEAEKKGFRRAYRWKGGKGE